ncbi:MAG: methyltransferase domain-containing protein, partial [Verrucomicrobiales bacterium]|nr:methyltransferase domain-containing protein [Verrucomicrobiales bacterium]
HGSKPKEQRRLARLNGLLNEACLRELALTGSETVLDVGSGLGQFTRDMARMVAPSGRVIGIERDKQQLVEARRQAKEAGEEALVDWRHGDALEIPLAKSEWGGFDVVHARFVLEHVKEPEQVVRQMVRAARPGGRVVLADDDHQVLRLWPEPPGFIELWQAYIRAYEHLGCDPFVGRRLVALLRDAGAKPRRNCLIFFGSCAGAAEFPSFVRNAIGVIETAREVMTGPIGFSARQFDRALRAMRQWGRRDDAAIWYGLCWAEGVRR